MSLARLVIRVEGRSKSAVAREYGHSRFWVHQLGQPVRCRGRDGV
jgi:hypothetical protein